MTPAVPDRKWPSLDLLYDEIQGRIAAQDAQISGLDSKANFGLASATLLTAGVTGLTKTIDEVQRPAEGSPASSIQPAIVDLWVVGEFKATGVVDALTIVSLVVYVLVIAFSFLAYRVRHWHVTPNPQQVLHEASWWPEEQTKATLAVKRADDFRLNEEKVLSKARWVRLALAALMVEAALLLTIALVQVRI